MSEVEVDKIRVLARVSSDAEVESSSSSALGAFYAERRCLRWAFARPSSQAQNTGAAGVSCRTPADGITTALDGCRRLQLDVPDGSDVLDVTDVLTRQCTLSGPCPTVRA